jgi:hypothetical protein
VAFPSNFGSEGLGEGRQPDLRGNSLPLKITLKCCNSIPLIYHLWYKGGSKNTAHGPMG